MWQERQTELLREEIEALLAPLSDIAGLYDLVMEPLTMAKRELAVEPASDWPWLLLPLIVCEAVSGHYEHAMPAAAATQLLKGAAEVFDDIEDADSSDSLLARYGLAAATNTATTLLVLAEKAIARLKRRGVADGIVVRVLDAVNSYYTTACAGQHLDLSLTPGIAISEDTYLRVAAMKSASQVECACHIGALLATAEQQLISLFSTFGHNLGMAAQITNDVQGIIHGSDITRKRITLPIIYALAQTNGEARSQLEAAFLRQSEATPDPAQIRDLLFGVGAIHYATIKMEFYKQRARDVLSEAEAAGASVERLRLFLE